MMREIVSFDLYQSDVYSLGVILLHLSKLSFPNSFLVGMRNSRDLKQAVKEKTQKLQYSPELLDLLKRMMAFDPRDRPTFEQVHIWGLLYTLHICSISRKSPESSNLAKTAQIAGELFEQGRYVDAKVLLLHFLSTSQGLTEEQQAQLNLLFAHLYFVSTDLQKEKRCLRRLL